MSAKFIGYRISPRWTKFTAWTFDAKTHARMCVDVVTPFRHFTKEQRREIITTKMKGLGLPIPPACFEPK